jgi:hypothetical protein
VSPVITGCHWWLVECSTLRNKIATFLLFIEAQNFHILLWCNTENHT